MEKQGGKVHVKSPGGKQHDPPPGGVPLDRQMVPHMRRDCAVPVPVVLSNAVCAVRRRAAVCVAVVVAGLPDARGPRTATTLRL
jgi:hypothetical protein